MKNLLIFDDDAWGALRPLTFNKPVSELVIGGISNTRRWEQWLGLKASFITQDHLAELFPVKITDDNLLINGSVIPSERLAELVKGLRINEALLDGEELVAARFPESQFVLLSENKPINEVQGYPLINTPFFRLTQMSDLIRLHQDILEIDVSRIHKFYTWQEFNTAQIIGGEQQWAHASAIIEPCYIDSREGAVIIHEGAKIMAGAYLKGPLVIGPNSIVKPGSQLFGPISIGEHCTIGGELKNTILFDFTNKGHAGYLGDSVLGSYVNLGADTNVSNLKNTLTPIHIWGYNEEKFVDTQQLKMGSIIADYSKTGIQTSLNTGTVIGVSCNIYGAGFPRKFIPSFSWGGPKGYINFELEKALKVAEQTKQLKDQQMSEAEKNMLAAVYKMTEPYRSSYH